MRTRRSAWSAGRPGARDGGRGGRDGGRGGTGPRGGAGTRAGTALLTLLALLGAFGCERGDPAAEREAAVEAPEQPPVAPDVPDEPEAEISASELGSIRAEDVDYVSSWTSSRLDRGEAEAPPISETTPPATPATPTAPAAPAAAVLDEVRIAEGDGFDRIVFEFSRGGELPAYHLSFVDAPLTECGSGREVMPGGDGWLFVQFLGTRAHDEAGESTIWRDVRAPGLPNLKEVHLLCDFEATVEWVAALAEPGAFRVIEADSPRRIVVDVLH